MSTPSQEHVQLEPQAASALADYLSTLPIKDALQHFHGLSQALQAHHRACEAAVVRNAEARGELKGEKSGIATGRAMAADEYAERPTPDTDRDETDDD